MKPTLAQLNARRAWYVPGVAVHGDLTARVIPALATEFDPSATRVVFYEFAIAGQVQEIPFSSLVDHRGNQLPASIAAPVVIPIPRNGVPVAVIGRPTATSCRFAKSDSSVEEGLVDLWIIEAGG